MTHVNTARGFLVLGPVLAVALGATSSGSRLAASGGQPPAGQQAGAGGIAPEALAQIEALLREKETRSPVERKIDSQLLYARRMQQGLPVAPGVQTLEVELPYAGDGHVILDVKGKVTAGLLAQVRGLSGEVVAMSATELQLHVDLDQVEAIAAQPDVVFVQPRQGAMTSRAGAAQMSNALGTGQGSVTSEADITHRTAVFRGLTGVNGAGVKIGVLSDGVDHLALAQRSGDLGPVTVLPGQAGFGDEGTAMLELIHDIAPGAQLYFATAFGGISSFAQNIRDLRAAGCDIIVDDVLYFVETPFQDGQAPGIISTTNGGVVIQAVKDVTAAGALYFSSAGNAGNLNDGTSGVWEGDFADGGATAVPLSAGSLHDFAAGQPFNTLTSAASSPISLFWSDPLGASANDYDLFRLDAAGTAVRASSTNLQTGTQDPNEAISQDTANSRVVVVKKTGAAGRFLHLNTTRGRLSVATAGQTHGHNSTSAPFSFGVAATNAGPAYPSAFSTSNVVETFSSDGPRRIILTENGTPITPGNVSSTGGQLLQKPDLAAADGVLVTGAGDFPSTFFGTSAAAPNAAAIAALFKSQNPSWTQAQLKSALLGSALDIEAPGVDRDSGAGIVMAVAPQPACTFTMAPPTASVGIAGGTSSVTVTASAGACTWIGWSTVAWINVSGSGVGTGSGPLDLAVAANPGPARSGTIVFEGGQIVTVVQAGTAATTFDNNTSIPLPRFFATTESSIIVSGLTGPISKVSVSFHITHYFDADLGIRLVGPDDTAIDLSVGNGFGPDFGGACTPLSSRTTLDDGAATHITSASPPFIGRFRPEQPLSTFDGKSGDAANGIWRLSIRNDDFQGDPGALVCWSLHINAVPPVATPPTGFHIDPPDQLILPGGRGTLSAVGTGSVPVSYQWYLGVSGDITRPIGGATSSSYTTPPLSSTTTYWARVSNPFGTMDTNTATVSVMTGGPIVVNSTLDALDAAPGNGLCATWHWACTLRAAIQEANAQTGDGVITLPAGTYTLTIAGSSEDAGLTGDLDIFAGTNITINGAGAATTIIDANGIDRAFHSTSGRLTLNDVTVRNGSAFGGGCIQMRGGSQLTLNRVIVMGCDAGTERGGGISVVSTSPSTVVLTDTTIAQNTTTGSGGGVSLSSAVTVMNRTTISGNSASYGGGLSVSGLSSIEWSLSVTNTTISGNTATAAGGALYLAHPPSTSGFANATSRGTLTNVTIASNSGVGGAVVVTSAVQPLQVRNTVIANSAGGGSANCSVTSDAAITDLGNNLEFPGTTCGFGLPSDRRADPLLGALANNGGLTQTHAPGPGSPAIDAGDVATCVAAPVSGLDQRGFARPAGGCAIGAYELGAVGIAPAIAAQPQNQTIGAGQSATLSVVATGTLPLTYQWYGGASGNTAGPIGGATSSSYTTPALQAPADYWVRVSSAFGTADSATATITISMPQAPAGLVATPVGLRIRLTWTASAGAASYTIKRSTSPGAETPFVIGMTGTSYSDSAVAKGQTYYYVVSAVNGGGESANSAEASATARSRLTPLDFDGDGRSDLTSVRPATFDWNTRLSQANFTTSTAVQWGLPGDLLVPGDYDGDGIVDPAVYRPSTGAWYALLSSTDRTTFVSAVAGLSTDIPVPGDYDGDGRTDPAVYRPSTGAWYVLTSSAGAMAPVQWGLPGDVPVAADYDGDGGVDPAVYRPSSGTWFVLQSSTGLTASATFSLGVSTDLPVPGDYDGDGRADPAVYRRSSGTWLRLLSSAGHAAATPVQWGLTGDLPVPADYDGDGKIDVAVNRPSKATSYVLLSTTGFTSSFARPWEHPDDVPLPIVAGVQPEARRLSDVDGDGHADLTVFRPTSAEWFTLTSRGGSRITQWGLPDDVPAPGDYDGDGLADRAVFRPANGTWYVLTSSSNYSAFFTVQWGVNMDVPAPGDYDGDGTTDFGVFRPATGKWFIRTSSSLNASQEPLFGIPWGLPTDIPVANDYDGDGTTDLAVFRPSTGIWYVLTSRRGFFISTITQWGLDADVPVPGDYDGDGRGDFAVFRPDTGEWHLLLSSSRSTTARVVQWGLPGDLAVPLDYDGDGKTDLAVYRPPTGEWYVLTSSSGYTTFFTRQWGLPTDVPILRR